MKFGVGQSVLRVEDQRLLTGAGSFTSDIHHSGQCHGVVVRSPHAHARIVSIDTSAASQSPGVLKILTADDLGSLGRSSLPIVIPITNRDGTDAVMPERPLLCADRVRHVGDHVAFVVAETLQQAKDAAELVEIDYDDLPAVIETDQATQPGQPLVHDDVVDNLAFDWEFGDRAATESVLDSASRVVELQLVNNRVVANSIETRSAVASYVADTDELTMHLGTQGVWAHQDLLSDILNMDKSEIHVLTGDVGGGFGMKAFFYPEYALTAWACCMVKRPVKWVGERSADAFVSDVMGRDHVTNARLGLDDANCIVGMVVETTANLGAYVNKFAPFIPTGAALKVLPGVYDVKNMVYRVRAVLTNTTPVDAYRGAGRPESIYLIERLIDAAARELGEDPAAFRQKNFVASDAMPFRTAAGEVYDTGDFATVMTRALTIADRDGFESRKAESAQRGKRRGWGMSYYVESTMGNPQEMAKVRFEHDDTVTVAVGTQSNGQGHATACTQVLVDSLGLPFEKIRVVQGDSRELPFGGGTGGSRSMTAAGTAIQATAKLVVERGREFLANEHDVAVDDIEFSNADGFFTVVGSNRRVSVLEAARMAQDQPPRDDGTKGLDSQAIVDITDWTFPNGCHVVEVEIDPETGVTSIDRYVAVDDFGVVINPLLLAGQVHGGVVQGIGQALLEQTLYDDSGQLLTGSLMDYCLPRADQLPSLEVFTEEIPCLNNALGIKGCGEAGTIAAPAAVIHAIIDALADLGVTRFDMPATQERVWRTIQAHSHAQLL